MGQGQSVMLTYTEELDDVPYLFVKMPTKGLKGDFHEYRQVVGCGQVFLVVGESFEEWIVEDVVDANGFTSTEGVHPACAALLESIDHIAQHGVVNVRVGDVVEVAAKNAGLLGGVFLVCNGDSLTGTEHHA